MSQYFPKPYEPFAGDTNVEVDLSNYTTKTDIENISHVDTSSFALKNNLANLKTKVDKLDIDKLVPVPVDFSKLSDVVKNVIKKNVYDKLVAKVNSIDTSGFVLKTKYDPDKSELENKIPDTSGLVKKTDYNTKINDIDGKIPDISNLATKTILTAVENKIPNVSSLVKRTDHDTKVTEIENKLNHHNHDKYITTQQFTTLSADAFNARLAQSNLIRKTDFDIKLSSLNRKNAEKKTKNGSIENEFKKLKTFDLSYFIGKSHFEEGATQDYLVFQPMSKYFKLITNKLSILSWKSKGLSNETIDPRSTSLSASINSVNKKIRVKFTGSCLKQSNKISYTHKTIVNYYYYYYYY